MNRISRHQAFMMTAEVWALRSTCFRRAVGAVLVQDNTIIAQGYNGPPSGEEHCTGKTCPRDNACVRAVHAEENVINRAGLAVMKRAGLDEHFPHSILYTTESPCSACADMIISTSQIREVYYLHEYRVPDGIRMLLEAKIKVFRMTPSGYIIDRSTEELVT